MAQYIIPSHRFHDLSCRLGQHKDLKMGSICPTFSSLYAYLVQSFGPNFYTLYTQNGKKVAQTGPVFASLGQLLHVLHKDERQFFFDKNRGQLEAINHGLSGASVGSLAGLIQFQQATCAGRPRRASNADACKVDVEMATVSVLTVVNSHASTDVVVSCAESRWLLPAAP